MMFCECELSNDDVFDLRRKVEEKKKKKKRKRKKL